MLINKKNNYNLSNNPEKRLRVVWLCHFTNERINKILKIKTLRAKEIAPWIAIGIEEVKKRKDIELYIVAPHRFLKEDFHFSEANITYFFFKPGLPFKSDQGSITYLTDLLTNYKHIRRKLVLQIKSINPDIIHLHGAENPYYSSAILDLLSYPNLLTIQGFISLEPYKLSNPLFELIHFSRIRSEKKILHSVHNFGIRLHIMKEVIDKYNKSATYYWHGYFVNNTPLVKDSDEKDFDIVFFARVCKEKGVEDLIKAIGSTKKKRKLLIIGSLSNNYKVKLIKLANELNCTASLSFTGFLANQEEVFNLVKKSKITVLPTYNDMMPGTIMESMFLGIPVIAYRTGGINELDYYEKKIIVLVKKGDVKDLSMKIEYYLENYNKMRIISKNAKEFAQKTWNNAASMDSIIQSYYKILEKSR